MKQRLTWAGIVLSAALLSACGVADSPTVGRAATAQPTVAAPTTEPTLPPTPEPTAAPTAAPATIAPQFSLDALAALKPSDVLLQLEYEPTFTMPEFTQPFGRIPQFTLLADGSVYFVAMHEDAEMPVQQLMTVKLSPEETVALLQQYLDAGLAQVETYTDMCEPGEGQDKACIADASHTVTRIRLPDGTLHESRNYASFATNGDVLKTAAEQLQGYSNPQATVYQPTQATMFVAPVAEKPDGLTILEWPLAAEWLTAPREGIDQWAKVVEGSDLETLLKATENNNGVYWFQAGEKFYRTSLVPWLPGQDYREAVEAYQMPPVDQMPLPEASPAPTP